MPRTRSVLAGLAVAFLAVACSSSGPSSPSNVAVRTAEGSSMSATAASASATATTSTSSSSNVWKAPGSVKLTALPLGDGHSSTTTPGIGTLYVCNAGDPNGPGSRVNGPWIHGDTF